MGYRSDKHKEYFNIPLEICQFCLSKKFAGPFALYLVLNHLNDGRFRMNNEASLIVARMLGYKTIRSVRNNMIKLVARNFVGYDPQSDFYYIHGLDAIDRIFGFERRTAIKFYIKDIKNLKAFLVAALITNLTNSQKKKAKAAGLKIGSSQQAAGFFPISALSLSKTLNISLATASRYKQLAKKAGYIDIHPNFDLIAICPKYVKTLRSIDPGIWNRVVIKNGKVYEQKPDLVKSNLQLKSRKK